MKNTRIPNGDQCYYDVDKLLKLRYNPQSLCVLLKLAEKSRVRNS